MSLFLGKTVLVTGSTGLIGSHIVDELMEFGDVKVIALGRSEYRLRQNFSSHIGNPQFSYIVQDISTPLQDDTPLLDYVFHAAGPTDRATIHQKPLDVISPNLTGIKNLLELLRRQKDASGRSGRLIVFSSVTVYGNYSNQVRTVCEENTETTEVLSSLGAPYSQSKRMVEVIAQAYNKQYGIDIVIARFSTVYGYAKFPASNAFNEFIANALSGNNIILQSRGLPRRDNIYIDDAISGLFRVSLYGGCGEAYNISSNGELGNFVAVDEIAEVILALVNNSNKGMKSGGIKVLYRVNEGKQRRAGLMLNNSKLKKLGWNMSVELTEGIKRTLAYYKQAMNGQG